MWFELSRLAVMVGVVGAAFLMADGWQRRQRARAAWLRADSLQVLKPSHSQSEDVSAALLLAQVSARLRAGASVAAAWDDALEPLAPRSPAGLDEQGVPRRLALIPALEPVAASVAAACRLTGELGIALAQILDSLLVGVEAAEAASHERAVAQAGPQMTARLLTWLPAVGVGAGLLLGTPVWSFAADRSIGSFVTIVGVGFWVAGHAWSRSLLRQTHAGNQVDRVILVELTSAAVAAGASLPRALVAVARAGQVEGLERCASLLQLGASLDEACAHLSPTARQLVSTLAPAWFFGAAPLPLLGLLSARWQRERSAAAREEAGRLAVKLVLPLGLCLLPAFVCLGVVPLVVTFLL
ncbi:MAG: type II secretion system F family protein [Actinomycetaceae bacterium]|nr:type II secretion system F family protein [Actinomycetaceae bacterium]